MTNNETKKPVLKNECGIQYHCDSLQCSRANRKHGGSCTYECDSDPEMGFYCTSIPAQIAALEAELARLKGDT